MLGCQGVRVLECFRALGGSGVRVLGCQGVRV